MASGGPAPRRPLRVRPLPTVLVGVAGGLVVGMTSVGSGSSMIVLLLLLYPTLRSSELVGTDLVQAIPLVASAAVGHLLRAAAAPAGRGGSGRARAGQAARPDPARALSAGPAANAQQDAELACQAGAARRRLLQAEAEALAALRQRTVEQLALARVHAPPAPGGRL